MTNDLTLISEYARKRQLAKIARDAGRLRLAAEFDRQARDRWNAMSVSARALVDADDEPACQTDGCNHGGGCDEWRGA